MRQFGRVRSWVCAGKKSGRIPADGGEVHGVLGVPEQVGELPVVVLELLLHVPVVVREGIELHDRRRLLRSGEI